MRRLETGNIEIASRIASYELAFRMQMAAPELADLSKESPSTLEMYGVNKETTKQFGTNCLLARRLVERGVRFVQLMHGSWDHHANLLKGLKENCDIIDQPIAALLKDLKQRGPAGLHTGPSGEGSSGVLLWCRTRNTDEAVRGATTIPFAFTMWMAGGGVKSGQIVGRTDDLGLQIVEDKIHIHDLHATILHSLGLDHKRLVFDDLRLTTLGGEVVHKLLA